MNMEQWRVLLLKPAGSYSCAEPAVPTLKPEPVDLFTLGEALKGLLVNKS